ncbi:hypothetical protein M5D96_001752 [Drosophila gunungcola]|uniref:Pumilio n=1 Tax=Drosophila gunungcola TaxID=103775 RepID=A0A9P9YZ35_9MUSC|nr:hypothetical protein M5D96_001752 [Drosophila gunungcola]
MKFLGGNDDRNGRGGVGVGTDPIVVGSRGGGGVSQDAADGYVFQPRPSPGGVGGVGGGVPGVGAVGSTLHEAAAAEYAAHFAQKQQQTRWACGDDGHGIDNPDKWKYNPPMNPANAAPGGPPGNGNNGGPGAIGTIGMGSGLGSMVGGGGGGAMHPGMNGGMAKPPPLGPPGAGGPQDYVYMGGQTTVPMGAAMMPPQNQYMNSSVVAAANRNAAVSKM